MRMKWDVARTGKGWDELQAITEKSRGERWLAYTNMSRSPERLRQVYETSMTYNPVPALEELDVPVLVYWGGKDTYLPVAESMAAFKQAMAKAGNKDYTIKVFPKGRHDLVEGDTGSPSAGARLKKFPEGFWKLQTDWLLRRVQAAK